MKIAQCRRVSSWTLFATFLALAAQGRPVSAVPIADCNRIYVGCVDQASELDSFLLRSAAGLSCAYDYVRCILRMVGR